MSYKEKPQIKLYSYINSSFVRMYIVDDYQSCSWERKKYEAGQFTIQINYNLPNSQLFKKGMFVQFGNDSKDFGIIQSVNDAVGANGKASQMRTITGYDCRYLYKRRIIRSLNSTDAWTMKASGELCMRNLIADQCGENADEKRRLPIANTIPSEGIGKEYTVSEAYSNLYDVLVTIATQSDVMWFVEFTEGALSLNFYEGNDLTSTVRLDTDYESLQNGNYTDSFDSFSNAVYVGGQGSGSGREIYEGEDADDEGNSPSGFDRFESWDDASTLTDSEEYETEAKSVLNEYAQTLTLTGAGLAKSPYVYKEQYDVGDTVKVKFNDIESSVQIQSVTEAWSKGNYSLAFEFGKPIKSLSRQLSLLLKKIQNYSATSGTTTVTSVKYYDVSTETEMASDEVTYDTIGFTGTISTDKTFTLYLNRKTGAKNYMVYVKNLSGGNVTLTTGVENASTVTLKEGTYCVEVYVDEEGNITSGTLIADTVESGNNNAISSSAVANALENYQKGQIADFTDVFPNYSDFSNATELIASLNSYMEIWCQVNNSMGATLYNQGVLPYSGGGVLHCVKTADDGRCIAEYFNDTGIYFHYETYNVSYAVGSWVGYNSDSITLSLTNVSSETLTVQLNKFYKVVILNAMLTQDFAGTMVTGTWTTCGQLPAGYYPKIRVQTEMFKTSGYCLIRINTNGSIQYYTTTTGTPNQKFINITYITN